MSKLWRHRQDEYLFLFYILTNLVLALLSTLLVIYVAPEGGGSGIPEVMSYLNGVRVKRFSSFRLLMVKVVGTILSVSSGLAVGPEGPLVHIGSIVGALLSKLSTMFLRYFPALQKWNPRLWSFMSVDLSVFSTDGERRDLIGIGAAAGFAAAFGAPIGGLLFCVEEASSFFGHAMFLKTLSATALATFCMAVHKGDLSEYGIISLGEYSSGNDNIFLNRVEELPLYCVVAVFGGLLGGIFVRVWKALQLLRKHRSGLFGGNSWLICEVAIVSVVTSITMFLIPTFLWTCQTGTPAFQGVNNSNGTSILKLDSQHFDCPPGEFNWVADIFFGSRDEAIRGILRDPRKFSPQSLLTVGLVFLPLMTITLGTALPTGVFMPIVLIGTSLGGFAGLVFEDWIGPGLSPSTFALLGAAALLAGVQRSTVSLCVILVEGTGQVKVLIPVIITVVIARYVADLIYEHGLYEASIEVNGYPYLEHNDRRALDIFPVRDIMNPNPVTIGPREEAISIVKLLGESEHHAFPVVDPDTSRFLGLVRRDQLVALLECGVFVDGESDGNMECDSDDEDLEEWFAASDRTPKPGILKSPLMTLAYHIRDDRYEHLERDSRVPRLNKARSLSNQVLDSDDFDNHAWLLAVRQSRSNLASALDIPPPPPPPLPCQRSLRQSRRIHSRSSLEFPDNSLAKRVKAAVLSKKTPIAAVGTTKKGSVVITWLNPKHRTKHVNVAAVMNRGSFTVPDFCPVSKAHTLFTTLGLRHLVVLGGKSGGKVVGVVTRVNFLDSQIEEKTHTLIE